VCVCVCVCVWCRGDGRMDGALKEQEISRNEERKRGK